MLRKYLHAVLALSLAFVTLGAVGNAHARIDRVVTGHVGNTHQTLGGNANYLFPLQTGLNKVTIQGNAALSTAKFVSLGSLKATSKIVGRGTNYLHLEIHLSSEAANGQTGDGVIQQPVSKGTPDKFRWKVFKRGFVHAIEAPSSVQLGERHNIVFRGTDLAHAQLIAQPDWSGVQLVSRTSEAVTYSVVFDECSGGKVSIGSHLLINEGLPPLFQSSLEFAGFRGERSQQVNISNTECAPPRIRGGAVRAACAPGYYRPTPSSSCVRRR